MRRRDFLQKSLFSFITLSFWQISSSLAAVVLEASVGKLGYKVKSPFEQKNCLNCKNYKAHAEKDSGECVLIAMKKLMKADVVIVREEAYCNMWAAIKK